MDENSRIFHEFGPNSGKGDDDGRTVRYDVGIWKSRRLAVVANNNRIADLIRANSSIVPRRYASCFQKWLNHIDAFEAHADDPLLDYRSNQFPTEVSKIIHRNV